MSLPRQILPASTYLISRRCSQRQFLLRPSALTNQIFAYCLAVAAEKTGVLVHAFCVLSNHAHGVVTDPHARLPEFLEHLHKLVAKAVNASLGRWENLWSAEPPSVVRLEDEDAVLREIVYCLANPVEAGLVSHGEQWPGLRTAPRDAGLGRTNTIRRPKVFFRKDGKMPQAATLRIHRAPIFSDLSDKELSVRIEREVLEREAEIRAEFAAEGRAFMGPVAVRLVNPFDSPRTQEPRRNLSPRVAASDPAARKSAIQRIRAFVADYRETLLRWRAGIREVLFPAGTYALRVFARVPCAEPSG